MTLGSHVHREDAREQVGVVLPASGDLGTERRGRPGVEHIGIADEPAGYAALFGAVARRNVGRRIDRQIGFGRQERLVVVDLAVGVEAIPDREGHAEESLTAHQPVAVESAHPVVVAVAHMFRMPVDLGAALDERGAQCIVATTVADVPLAAGDDLEGSFAALVELDRMGDGADLADELAALGEHLDHLALGLFDGESGDLGIGDRVDVGGRLGEQATIASDDGAHREVEFAPPQHVGHIAEGADHGDPGALVGVGEAMRHHGDVDAEQRCAHGGAEQRLIARVIGVGHECHTGGEQFGPRRVDPYIVAARLPGGVETMESDRVICARTFAVLHLGLCDRGLEVDVPHGGCLLAVGLAARQIAQEGALARPTRSLVDGGIQQRPVDRESESPEQVLEDLFVDGDEFVTEFDEVRARDRDRPVIARRIAAERRFEVGDMGLCRIAADAEVVLDAAFGGQSVVVPAHGIEHRPAAHPLIARDRVGVGVAEHMSHVQRAAHGRRRGVDREHLGARRAAVEAVQVGGGPRGVPALFESVERRSFRHGRHSAHRLRPRRATPPVGRGTRQ